MAEPTDISLIRMIANATIRSLSDRSPSVASWNGLIYRVGLIETFAPNGIRVRGQLADLRLEDPDLILAGGEEVPPFMIFGAQWRQVVEQFDSEELPAALLQLYRYDRYPDPRIRTEAFKNATRALTELAPDLTARLSSSAIETIVANVPIADIALTPADGLDDYTDLTRRWYEAARDPEQREALTLGVASNATFPSQGGVADLGEDFYRRALADVDENVLSRASVRRAAVAATYLSIGISEEPRKEADAAPERLDRESVYWLWITLGPPVSGGIGLDVQPIRPEALAGADEVVVALFADEGVRLSPGPPQVTFRSDGVNHFVPVSSDPLPLPFSADGGRAWIRFQTPREAGTWHVRCGVFVAGVLVHVETLTVAVGSSPDTCGHRTTFRTLGEGGSSQLDLLEAPTLTLYANQSGSSIDLSFYAPGRREPLIAQGSVDEIPTLERLKSVRSLLSSISYGSPEVYSGQDSRYRWCEKDQRYTSTNESVDIRTLALRGNAIWEWFQGTLDKSPDERKALRALMRQPGTVEVVLKRDARYVLPAQIFYDHPLDDMAPEDKLELCQGSARWLDQPVGELVCLAEGCPDYENRRRVCFSGFWGFRHGVSTRFSVRTDCHPWPITELSQHGKLVLDHAISKENEIQKAWQRHSLVLKKYAELRNVTIGPDDGTVAWVQALGAGDPPGNILYFLAHMELDKHYGQIISFDRKGGPKLGTSAINDSELKMCGGRPLLFLNGCESAGQDPLTLLSLINNFLERGASGAVGTEITVFLDMATRFAEAFVEAFGRAPLGEAMRLARWDLLRKGSPLGLIYLAVGLVHLHMPRTPNVGQAPEHPI